MNEVSQEFVYLPLPEEESFLRYLFRMCIFCSLVSDAEGFSLHLLDDYFATLVWKRLSIGDVGCACGDLVSAKTWEETSFANIATDLPIPTDAENGEGRLILYFAAERREMRTRRFGHEIYFEFDKATNPETPPRCYNFLENPATGERILWQCNREQIVRYFEDVPDMRKWWQIWKSTRR
ncbi:hypothetical protein [Blastopirellula marina]|uniref:Uncharacterized protein n=1 Tax=Blastopirellula marina TaxID=124 RepID=A0A2S8GBB3_9BACT|nr:hypothetical protein [Blastopirellula marina]PQO41394.1 hypothetical protein C5Y93_30220 [Blastopirellula marina]